MAKARNRKVSNHSRKQGMIGLLLVANEGVATCFFEALKHVVGPQKQTAVIDVRPESHQTDVIKEIRDAITRLDTGKGVLIAVDHFDGAASNYARKAADGLRTEIICGLNLPMLIKITASREQYSLIDLGRIGIEAGRKYISIASELLADSSPSKPPKIPRQKRAPLTAQWAKSRLTSSRIGPVRPNTAQSDGRLSNYQHLRLEAERLRILLTGNNAARRGERLYVTVGVGGFEDLLALVGISGPVSDGLRKNLYETSQVRNLVVHNGSVVDRKFKERCPWLDVVIGTRFEVTADRFRVYSESIAEYASALYERVRKTLK